MLAACCAGAVSAQPGKFAVPADRAAPGGADQAEGARVLSEFRDAAIASDYWLAFELRVLPRKGVERVVPGAMIGTRGDADARVRLEVAGQHWLIQSGPKPAAWLAAAGGAARALRPDEAGLALADTGVTVFDLQRPFLYWENFTYEGQATMRGRPTHSFVLRPPAGTGSPIAGLTGVRVFIDAQFEALVQADELGANGAVEKTIALLDLKKVGKQWLVKAIDVRNARTRDKTRLAFTGAALNLAWPAGIFDPAQLGGDAPAVPPDKIVRF